MVTSSVGSSTRHLRGLAADLGDPCHDGSGRFPYDPPENLPCAGATNGRTTVRGAFHRRSAEVADPGSWFAHGRHGEPEFRRGHLVGASAVTAAGPGGGEPDQGAFGVEFAFKFGQGGEDPENKLPGGGGGVDGRSLAGEDFASDASFGEVVDDVDQVAQVPAYPVQFPDYEGVAVAQGLEAGRQLRSVLLPGGTVVVEGVGLDAGDPECVALQVRSL